MRYFSTFSGIGGFELAIAQAYETIASKNNQSKIEECNALNATKKESFTKEEKYVKNASESINSNGESTISNTAEQRGENITPCGNNECLKCMGENASVAKKKKKNSSPLNTETEMGIRIGSDMEQATCTNLHSKKTTKESTRYSATTATMQKADMENAPTCVGYSEIDKYASSIYAKHFPKHTNFGDITKINAEELPDFDLLVGGFPCQAFSIAGKRKGFEDTRGTLFFDLARILRAKRPRLFLFENVKGLLSHDNGATFKTIITTLTELGYDLQWQVLNSKNFGVPQNRERVFIIGHLRGTSRPKVFPIGQGYRTNENKGILAHTLNASDWRGANRNQQQTTIRQLNNPTHSNDRVYGADGISPTLNTMQGGRRQPFVAQEEMKIRRLTPMECERLQGFPDGWTEGLSDTQRYKTLGNAVTVNVIEDIMRRVLPSPEKEDIIRNQEVK